MPLTVVLGSVLTALTLFPLSAAAVYLGLAIRRLGSPVVSFFSGAFQMDAGANVIVTSLTINTRIRYKHGVQIIV